jgi:DNA-binding transcriptional LysR family regulator
MDIRQLRYFVSLSETLHFRRTAEELNSTQPSVTQNIQALEAEIGVRLFERDRRSVQLTEAGQSFRRDAQRILSDLENATQRAREIQSGKVAVLSVAAWTVVLLAYLPRMLAAFRESHPAVTVNLSSTDSARGLEALRRHEIDLAIVREMPEAVVSDFHVARLWEHPYVVVIPVSHPAASLEAVALRDLSNEGLVTFPRVAQMHNDVMNLCAAADFIPVYVQETVDIESMIAHVACGSAVAIVPAPLDGIAYSGVVFKPISEPTTLRVATSAFWRKSDASEFVEAFIAGGRPDAFQAFASP